MKSLEARFKEEWDKHPFSSTFIVMMRAVAGQGFSQETISRWFPKLVDKDDYVAADKQRLIDFMTKHSQK